MRKLGFSPTAFALFACLAFGLAGCEPFDPQDCLPELVKSPRTSAWPFDTLWEPDYIVRKDTDRDGLPDKIEWHIAMNYEPYLIFDPSEPIDPHNHRDFDIYYQVTPTSRALERADVPIPPCPLPRRWETGEILVTYILTYDKDYGVDKYEIDLGVIRDVGFFIGVPDKVDLILFGEIGEHNGETEKLQVALDYYYDPCNRVLYTKPRVLRIKRHYEPEKEYQFKDVPTLSPLGFHPTIYVSSRKHAMYLSIKECLEYVTYIQIWDFDIPISNFESCGKGSRVLAHIFTDFNQSEHNVGEYGNPGLSFTYQFNGFPLWQPTPSYNQKFCGNHTSDCGAAPFWEKWWLYPTVFGILPCEE